MRPTSAIALVVGLLTALAGAVLTVLVFVGRDGGKPWHYWISPLLTVGFVALLLALAAGYYLRIGRLEMKGRQRGE